MKVFECTNSYTVVLGQTGKIVNVSFNSHVVAMNVYCVVFSPMT